MTESAIMTATKLRILLVEDHVATANALKRYLAQVGYDVLVAPDARSARQIAANEEFDVLLSDIGLPDGNGWNLMRELKRKHDIAGIAISGFGAESDFAQSKKVAFRYHLVKPLSPDELTDALEELAAERQRSREESD
jgi:DNA-binding response OmpR family regulator